MQVSRCFYPSHFILRTNFARADMRWRKLFVGLFVGVYLPSGETSCKTQRTENVRHSCGQSAKRL